MIGEIKHYDNTEKPWGLFVNNEFIGDYATLQEAAEAYEKIIGKDRKEVNT